MLGKTNWWKWRAGMHRTFSVDVESVPEGYKVTVREGNECDSIDTVSSLEEVPTSIAEAFNSMLEGEEEFE